MSSQLEAKGDRKVTPGVTGSSRARAPIDPAVWYLGPLRALGQNRGNAIEVSADKIRVSAYIGETRPPLSRTSARTHWEERERATPREVQRDFSTRSDGRINRRTSYHTSSTFSRRGRRSSSSSCRACSSGSLSSRDQPPCTRSEHNRNQRKRSLLRRHQTRLKYPAGAS